MSMKRTEKAIQEFLDSNFNEAVEDMQRVLTDRVACSIQAQNFKYFHATSDRNVDFREPRTYVKPIESGACLINDISDIVSEYLADKGILLDAEQEEQTNE